MSGYSTLNYSEQGGEREVIGGSLDVVSGGEIDIESGGELKIAGTTIDATAAEINNAADVSARVQELTVSGAVTAGVQSVELNHTSVTIAATIADAANHQGLFIVKATTEPGGGGDHTLTLTAGTFDGTNNIATFADIKDALVVYFDSAGNGSIIENIGAVGLSS